MKRFIFVVTFVICIASFASKAEISSGALITMTQGDVQIFSQPKAKSIGDKSEVLYQNQYWKSTKARFGEKIQSGSVVHTGTDGKLRLILPNSDVINIGPSSSIVVSVEMEATGKTKSVDLDVLYGKLRAVAQKEEKEKKNFKVKTSAAVMGVRGTDFSTSFNPAEGRVNLSVLRGEVEMKPTQAKVESVQVKPGTTAVLQLNPDMLKSDKENIKIEKPKIEIKETSQETLVEIQKASSIRMDEKALSELPKKVKEEVILSEQKAKDKTLTTIKIEDPQLYQKLILTPAKDVNEIQGAAVAQALQVAPKDNPAFSPMKKSKKTKEEILEGDDEIYKKYFKTNDE